MWPVAVALLARRVSKSARSALDLNLWSWSVILVQGFLLFLWLYNLNIETKRTYNNTIRKIPLSRKFVKIKSIYVDFMAENP